MRARAIIDNFNIKLLTSLVKKSNFRMFQTQIFSPTFIMLGVLLLDVAWTKSEASNRWSDSFRGRFLTSMWPSEKYFNKNFDLKKIDLYKFHYIKALTM
jgi:hypothetical protein